MKTILVDAYQCLFNEKGINKEMQSVLDNFSNPKIILTNASGEKLDFLEKHKPKDYKLFTLHGKPRKTENGYYEKMLEHFALKPSKCVYIEHSEEALDKAQKVGITESFHWKGDFELLEELMGKVL